VARGQAQAPIEERGGAYPVAIRWEPVLTSFPAVDRRSQTSPEAWERVFCSIVSFSLGNVVLVLCEFRCVSYRVSDCIMN